MGIYDREYYRDEPRGLRFGGDWSAVTTLIVLNVAIWLAELFTSSPRSGSWVEQKFALQPDLFHHPLQFWQLLTYGFVHDSQHFTHILFNMIGLFVFGRDVEIVYGRTEFYKIYLSLVILSGLVFAALQLGSDRAAQVEGASGGIMGIAVLFACNFPRRMMLIFPIPIPIPAYILVGFYVLMDLLGSQTPGDNVAHAAHLGGAAFGFLYYKTGWNLFRLWPSKLSIRIPRFGPKLKVHNGSDGDEPQDDYLSTGRLQMRVDQLLEKISREGESSLTNEERQFLADASRRYQQQKRR